MSLDIVHDGGLPCANGRSGLRGVVNPRPVTGSHSEYPTGDAAGKPFSATREQPGLDLGAANLGVSAHGLLIGSSGRGMNMNSPEKGKE